MTCPGEQPGTPGRPRPEERVRTAFGDAGVTDGVGPAVPVVDRHRTRGPAPRSSRRSKIRWTVLALVHVAILIHLAHWKITGRTLSPLEPSESMQTLELGYLNAGFVVFALLILSTLIFGRFFCGWGCHVVAYQDGCAWILEKLGIKPRPVRSRLLVLIPFGAAFYMFLWPTVHRILQGGPAPALANHLTTETFWATFPGPIIAILTILVDGFLVVYFLGAKGFCTYGCPYGAFFGLADRVAAGKIKVTDDCNQCGHCTATCTSNVRVHEEVAKFKMVVDSGCMKCLDCVSVCPRDALYFGKGRPSVFGLSTILRRKKRVFDFTWPEEIAMALIFLGGLYAFRSLYDVVPLLLSIGLSVILALLLVLGWRLLRRPTFAFQNHVLRRDGSLTRAGKLIAAAVPLVILFTAHSTIVQVHAKEGTRLLIAAESADDDTQAHTLEQSLRHLRQAQAWGLIPVGSLHLKIGSILRTQGDLDGAEQEMRAALAADPSMKTPRLELARILTSHGQYAEAERYLQELVEMDPHNQDAQRGLQFVREKLGH
ncbi:MAG: 4Fe-4S binding protein [Candidatus Eisenbacteria bacterium]|uniref:4Fe-4S binding protein n=1 Tax=Eiseniibacteriota bacterium TaxID=2212470 RepID=A0A956LYF0_UNCEI|nr:4Fe-4S binding protein [Candidatus Eisenbacteria bacterium]